jgi:ABC-2 type transport system permease protein
MKALYLKELRSFLSSIIGYIFIGIFLVLNSLFLWVFSYETNILEGGTADLRSFFGISPIIFLILIPAITMRSFSEERRTGTIELLFTKPISDFTIIFTKYLAGVTLVFISILPTLIYYYSVHNLGEPVGIIDDGATITSYLGLMLVGACLVAVGIFASSVTDSQIVSFILSMFLSWFLFMGLDLLAVYSQFGGLDLIFRNLGIMEHYESIQKGVIDTRDIIYFISFAAVFILSTKLVLQARKW